MNRSELVTHIKRLSGEPDSSIIDGMIDTSLVAVHNEIMNRGLWWFQFARDIGVVKVPAYQGYAVLPQDYIAPLFVACKPMETYDSVDNGKWLSVPSTAVTQDHFQWSRLRRMSQPEAFATFPIVTEGVTLTSATYTNVDNDDIPQFYWSDEVKIYFNPIPNADMLCWFLYFRRLVPLGMNIGSNDDENYISKYHPELYIWGVLRDIFTAQNKTNSVMDAERRFGTAMNQLAKENWARIRDIEVEFSASVTDPRGIASPAKVYQGYGKWS